jgi:hypothetical protein
MYCISDDDYLRDFNMMLNDDIIDCFSEKKPETGVINHVNEVIKNIVPNIYDDNIRCEKDKLPKVVDTNIIPKNIKDDEKYYVPFSSKTQAHSRIKLIPKPIDFNRKAIYK